MSVRNTDSLVPWMARLFSQDILIPAKGNIKEPKTILPHKGYILPIIPHGGYILPILPHEGYILPILPHGGYILPHGGYILPFSAGYKSLHKF